MSVFATVGMIRSAVGEMFMSGWVGMDWSVLEAGTVGGLRGTEDMRVGRTEDVGSGEDCSILEILLGEDNIWRLGLAE